MAEQRLVSDGNADFSGGMDSFRSPSFLEKNQYYCSVNCQIKSGVEGISTRPGYREITLKFDNAKNEQRFRSGEIQGNGYYITRNNILIILCSVDGFLFEFTEIGKYTFSCRVVGGRNDPIAKKAYFTTVPEGCIINDGISAPIYAKNGSYSRVSGNKNISAGRAGVYIQNRYFYIDERGESIIPSSFNNPISIEERLLNNLTGFLSPDETEIKAIGVQRVTNKNSQGGSLLFSTRDNIYSADVSGPMSNWNPQSGYGSVTGAVYDVAAVSPFSFLSANSNVYFRSRDLGIASLQYMQYIWDNVDIIETQSYGGHLFFKNDSELFLDCCYSSKCNNNIYTTVSPSLSKTSVYWEGILVCRPGQKGLIRYDSLYTGIRPWCFQTIKNQYGKELLHIFSKDHDNVNRFYIIDESIDYDLRLSQNPKKDIESVFISRFMDFGNPFLYKKSHLNQMFVSVESNDLDITITSRLSQGVSFRKVYNVSLKDTKCSIDKDGYKPKVAEDKNEKITYGDSLSANDPFISSQQMICLKGSFRINKIIRTAANVIPDKVITQEKPRSGFSEYITEKFFTYKLYE